MVRIGNTKQEITGKEFLQDFDATHSEFVSPNEYIHKEGKKTIFNSF